MTSDSMTSDSMTSDSMTAESIDTLVVGGGQAGIAMSEHLSKCGIQHLVLERDRIAESWRTRRWDTLVANGPAWHDRFPGLTYPDTHPDAFPTKDGVVAYLERYAREIDAPIRTGVEVTRVSRRTAKPGFQVETTAGPFDARNVITATGAFHTPLIPPIVPERSGLTQIHSVDYRNPTQLPEGAVMVVGAGSSGVQIAEELARAGRTVYLSVGPHHRPPRSYRERDYCWWLGVLGKWDLATVDPATAHVTISVSGARGGHTVDFRTLAGLGITLVGMTQGCEDSVLRFAPDLVENIAAGDENYLSVLHEADAYIERNGLDLPPEPDAHVIGPDPDCMTKPLDRLDLAASGVSSIIWATGYRVDFGWMDVDVFEPDGRPRHLRGVTDEPGIYFLGLPWLSRRGSSFIWGVWHDARYIADHIATQQSYLAYDGRAERITS